MLNIEQTKEVLEQFFEECLNFWRRDGKSDEKAYQLAIEDIVNTKHNPYSPQDELLDEEIKEIFIKFKS